jgi:putative oxidoreductase
MTTTDELRSGSGTTHQIGMFTDRLIGIVHTFAQPSLVQLVMRLALAVPFWRSGINKWDGFLQLKDTTVLLFSEEFMLHLPGGPYHYPAPAVFAFIFPVAARFCSCVYRKPHPS